MNYKIRKIGIRFTAIALFISFNAAANFYFGDPAEQTYFIKIRRTPKKTYPTPAGGTVSYTSDPYWITFNNLPLTNSIDLYGYVCDGASCVRNQNPINWECTNPNWTIEPQDASAEHVKVKFGASGEGVIKINSDFSHPWRENHHTNYTFSVKINIETNLPPHIFDTPILPQSPEPCVTQTFIDLRWGHNFNNGYIHALSPFNERKNYYARMFAFVTLQGLVNRVQPRLYQIDSWYQMYASLLDDYMLPFYTNIYNMVFNEETNLYSLIKDFAKPPEVERVVIYRDSLFSDHDKGDLINYMTALCAISNCIALSTEDYQILTNEYDFSLPVLEILNDENCAQRGLTNSPAIYNYMIDNFWPQCSRRAIAHIHPLLFQVPRDYLVAHKIFPFFYRKDFKEMYSRFDDLLKEMPLNAAILGTVGVLSNDNKDYCRWGGIVTNEITGQIRTFDFIKDKNNTNIFIPVDLGKRRSNPVESDYELVLKKGEILITTNWGFMVPIPFHDIADSSGNTEEGFWKHTSKLGKTAQYTAGIANSSFRSGFDANNISFRQNINTNIPYQPNKVYMCSFMSEGDNMDYSKAIFYNRWLRDGVATNNYVSLGFNLLMYELAPDVMDYYYKNKGNKISIDAETGVGSMEVGVYGTGINFDGWTSANKKDFALKSYLKMTKKYLEKFDIRVIRPNFQLPKDDFYVYAEQLSGAVDALGPAYWAKFNFIGGTVQDMQREFVITNEVVFLWDDWAHKIQKGEHEKIENWVYDELDAIFPQFHSCWFQYCHGWYENWLSLQKFDVPSHDNYKVKFVPPIVFQNFFRKSKGVK